MTRPAFFSLYDAAMRRQWMRHADSCSALRTATEQPVWGQGISVEWIEFCRCRVCTPYTVAYVTQDNYHTINVCARAALTVSDLGSAAAADGILKHELGHVLGQPDHIEGPETAMMTGRQLDQHPPVRKFTDADLDFVCSANGIVSPRCSSQSSRENMRE